MMFVRAGQTGQAMSAEIINLRRARKERARVEKERQAEENRRLFGLSKAERKQTDDEKDRASRRLDGHEIQSKHRSDDE